MFTDYEHSIEEHIFELKNQQRKDLEELQIIQDYYSGNITEQCAIERLERVRRSTVFVVPMKEEIPEIYERIEQSKIEERREKQRLREAFTSPPPLRHLRPEFLKPSNIISIFESSLTRTLQLNTNELTDAIMIIRIYYYDVFRDMVLNGFDYNGVHYRAYTASAGQIRCKKMVFIREDVYLRHEKTIMCGLSLDHINELGGCNTNKFLAYLALGNSATDLWPDFDIDKSIVVEDMETAVHGMVDYIDDKTYQITRQEMDIDIAHTDGCGMVLPRLTGGKNTMIRLPWVKGLIAAFPFDEFIREKSKADGWNYGLVKDIYGQVHDVLAEGIEVIFCKSQFKLWKYYESWEQYKQYYKEYGCTAGVCNWEEDYIDNASIGYQMLQTLTDLTDDELLKLSAQTRYQLEHICNDRRTMLKALGATKGNPHKSPAQECLLLYPELLQDKYYRESLRGLKQSMEKWAWGGKLSIYGKYLFLIPDLYAFCEFLFLGDKNPKGLLQDGEVYAALFPAAEKLDCLRSPHLYREHAVRHNVAGNEQCKRWFGERGIYTSCHDLISKILMFDNDGDKSLVCADKTLITAAERNMEGIVPLFYPMRKASSKPVTPQSIYDGMVAAMTGGNIGVVSNAISKIWNSAVPDLDTIKRLCYRNNEVIDYAKTLYKSVAPKDIAEQMSKATRMKVPHYFVYAKNKTEEQVEPRNGSPVNRLLDIVPKFKFNFNQRKGGRFDYHILMNNPDLERTAEVDEIIAQYKELSGKMAVRTVGNVDEDGVDRYTYQYQELRRKMFEGRDNPQYVVDAIILGIFGLTSAVRKAAFWGAFGDMVLANLQKNLSERDDILCQKCYNRFTPIDDAATCPYCSTRHHNVKSMYCVDCGEEFFVDIRNNSKVRCNRCQCDLKKEKTRLRVRKFRQM